MAESLQRFPKGEYSCPEEAALTEFVSQLRAKRLTPEAFFRVCDTDYCHTVTQEHFITKMDELRLKLSPTQSKRLMLLLDENFTGSVTLSEFQDALEAFKLQKERHISVEPGQTYVAFSVRAA
jgi:Ca2+-binding EF-hand superfamily protein